MRPLLLLCLLLALPARAQVVDGRVLDRASARPVSGAGVDLMDGTTVRGSAVTDSAGLFRFTAPGAGAYRLAVQQGGARTLSRLILLEEGDTSQVEMRVLVGEIRLEAVVAVAAAGPRRLPAPLAAFYERAERRQGGRFVTRATIDQRGATRTSDLLRGMAGLNFTFNRRGGSGVRSRGCEPMLWVDGVQVPPGTLSLDDLVQPQDIEGIEVYSGPASLPADFVRRGAFACGAILVWTRQAN